MKANSRKSTRLRAALLAIVATALAFIAYAATVDDIVPINEDITFVCPERDGLSITNDLSSDKHFYFSGSFGFNSGGPYKFSDGTNSAGQDMKNRKITFIIKNGYTGNIKVYSNIKDKSTGGIYITASGTIKSTITKGTDIITWENAPAGTYEITGDADALFCGIKVEVSAAEKPAASLTTITEDYNWRISAGDQLNGGCNYLANEALNEYYVYYTGANSLEATLPDSNGPSINGQRVYGYNLPTTEAIGFEIGKGKGTITLYISDYWANITVKKGNMYPSSVQVEFIQNGVDKSETIDGIPCITKAYTYNFDNSDTEVYWFNIGNGNAVLAGFDVKFDEAEKPFELEAPNLATITDDFSWICTSGVDLTAGNNTPVTVDGEQKYYLYYNSADGSSAGMTESASVLLHGGPSLAYNLNDKRLGFKVGADAYVIDFYTAPDATVTLYTGDDATTTTEDGIKKERTVTVNGVSAKVTRFLVDEVKETTLWAQVSGGAFAGFDVMTNTSSASAITTAVNPLPVGTGIWTPTATEQLYNSGMGTVSLFKSGKGKETYFYHLGQTVVLDSEYPGCVPLGDEGYGLITAIGFRLDGARKSTIKVYAKGSGNYKVVSGADPLGEVTEIASCNTGVNPGEFTLTTTEEQTLWVIGDKGVFVEKIEYDVKEECVGPLATIKGYHLWRAGETIESNTYLDANYLRYNTSDGVALTPDTNNTLRVLGIETPTVILNNNNEIVIKLAAGTKGKVNIYYTGANNDLQIKSGGSEEQLGGTSTAWRPSQGVVTEVEGTKIWTYPYERSTNGYARIVNNGKDVRIAAIEVIIDKDIEANGQKNIDWYVCGDSKMIAGSERVEGNTEYAEFYASKGRVPRVSFFMPSILKVFYQGEVGDPDGKYKVTVKNGGSKTELTLPKLYQKNDKGKLEMIDTSKGDIWPWMTQDWKVNPKSDNTQTFTIEAIDVDDDGNERTWNVHLTFYFIDCPTITVNPSDPSSSTSATLTMTKASGYDAPIFYTVDSTDPADLDNTRMVTNETEGYYSTGRYGQPAVVTKNCIALAAQYIQTERPFYTDGPGTPTSSLFKLLSEQKYVRLADREDIIYVNDPTKGAPFAKTAGDIDVLEVNDKPVMRFMYGAGTGTWDGAVRFFRTIDNEDRFRLGAVKWGGTKDDQDGGYDTYMDPYEFTLAGSDPNKIAKNTEINGVILPNDVSFNANPDTEMNGGIGGINTEDGGMFLQPVAGDFFRLEPEYDGVATVWVRQNGMVDYGNMYNGELTRRPVYVVDEDGVIQRGSTILPSHNHHLSVNGVYAKASGRNELRASFANTWKYATTYDKGWNILHDRIKRADGYFPYNFEVMQIWFGDIVKFTTKGTDNYQCNTDEPSTAPIEIDRANSVNLNRYSRIGTQLLYRDDWMHAQEMKLLEKYPNANDPFAKYGYEIPNFGYVQYRIPVKAGKTYYMGGRGTKNGFVAMQFEPLPPNYDNRKYQRIDNANIIDNGTERATLQWTHTEPGDTVQTYSPEAVMAEYENNEEIVKTLTIKEDGGNSTWWDYWPYGDDQDKYNHGDGMLKDKITINVDLYREFEAGKWYPIVLPFSVSESRLREMFGKDVKVLYLDPKDNSYSDDSSRKYNSVYRPAVKDTELKFTYHYYQMLYANTPAFICPSAITTDTKLKSTDNGKSVYHFRRVCFEKGSQLKTYDIGGGYEVTGSYAPTSASDNGEMYYISNENGKVVMYHSRAGIDMRGTRCWIRPKKGASNAPIMTMGFGSFSADGFDDDSGTTGITDVISDDAPATLYDNDNVYDIMGRVAATGSTTGLPSGVYIFKGKKVYVK